jgi:hypothetical protein
LLFSSSEFEYGDLVELRGLEPWPLACHHAAARPPASTHGSPPTRPRQPPRTPGLPARPAYSAGGPPRRRMVASTIRRALADPGHRRSPGRGRSLPGGTVNSPRVAG